MTYVPTAWADGDCVMAADMNQIEAGIDRAQGDVMVLRGLTANRPATDPDLVGRLYIETDGALRIWRDNGGGWDQVPTGAADYARYYWGFPRGGDAYYGQRPFTANYVFLTPIDIPYTLTIDRLMWWTGTAAAGNMRIGIYAEGAADTPAGGALQVESASVAVINARNCQAVTVADTSLTAGQYYIGIMGSNAACNWWGSRDETGDFAYEFNPHAYGAFPDPCPAVNYYNYIPMLGVRVKSIP